MSIGQAILGILCAYKCSHCGMKSKKIQDSGDESKKAQKNMKGYFIAALLYGLAFVICANGDVLTLILGAIASILTGIITNRRKVI